MQEVSQIADIYVPDFFRVYPLFREYHRLNYLFSKNPFYSPEHKHLEKDLLIAKYKLEKITVNEERGRASQLLEMLLSDR